MNTIQKVAVIGAGTMGAGIAGQVANAGYPVLLLDMPSDGDAVNAIAERGLARLKNPDSPGLMSDDAAALIETGNIRDDLARVSECDWVVEAVVERLDIKHTLYRNLAEHLKPTAMLSSNTSTIPIALLTEGMDADLQSRFAITHFFNPVRFMRLLELVRGEKTADSTMQTLHAFCEAELGKGVVPCLDTPGFLANRVGCFAIQCALYEAEKFGLTPPEADAIFGRPMGIPKTGVFGLYDLIGIDLMADVAKSLTTILPAGDAFHAVGQPLDVMVQMIANDQRGNKSGQGFYRGDDEVVDLANGQYVTLQKPIIDVAQRAEQEGVVTLLADNSKYGQFAWSVLSQVLCYSAELLPEVGDDPLAIDDAMKLGYNWIYGPFELIDQIGVDAFCQRLRDEGRAVPAYLQALNGQPTYAMPQRQTWDGSTAPSLRPIVRSEGLVRLNELRHTLKPEARNASASWYVYEGAALVEFHSKANALDGDSMAIIADAVAAVPKQGLAGVVVHNDAQHFSCGVNLGAVRGFYQREDFEGLDAFLDHFQQTVHSLSVAQFPTVVAPVGMSIGGGFEVVLHGQQVIAHANSVTGLVESLVGLVPAGGGCKETLYRWVAQLDCGDNIEQASWQAFRNLGFGKTCTSPILSKADAMLRADDRYEMNRDNLLVKAVEAVQQGEVKHHARPALAMPGAPVYNAMKVWLAQAAEKGQLFPHDVVVGTEIAEIVTGGDVDPGTLWTEQDLFDAERRAFWRLASSQATQARINSMLDLGQKIRN